MNRRVKCFLKRKRDEINLHNIIDFKQQLTDSAHVVSIVVKDSCARTQSIPVKQQQSISHIKGKILFIYETETKLFKYYSLNLINYIIVVHRAFEDRGQSRPNYSSQLNKLMTTKQKHCELVKYNVLKSARLQHIEEYMHITPDHDDNIYKRIKDIENRILMLESTSPEYEYYVSTYFYSYKFCN